MASAGVSSSQSSPADTALGRLAAVFARGPVRHPGLTILFGIVGLGAALLHLWQIHALWLPGGMFKAIHLNLAILISLLGLLEGLPDRRCWTRRLLALLALLSLLPLVYIPIEYQALVDDRSFLPNGPDLIIAVLMLFLALFVAVREWGWIIPSIAVVGLLYGAFGDRFESDLLFHAPIAFDRLIGYTSIPYFRGLLGSLTAVSASTIFVYMLFAGILKSTGGLDLLMKMAFAVGRHMRAGPAQAAVVGSGFMGMISGSTMANVASTGAFTIPMMKRFGFQPHFAGAVESVASAGGQVTPPKMGLAAFLIVGITGIPYVDVMAAAVFPAIIYYAYLLLAVHVQAVRLDLGAAGGSDDPAGMPLADLSMGRALLLYGHPVIGIVVLVWLLLAGQPANTSALYTILIIVGIELAKQAVLAGRRPLAGLLTGARNIASGLASGAHAGAQVAVVVAVISVMVEMVVATGFAQKLSHMMLDIAGGELWPLLIISALTCLVFGVGLPTSAAYILVALLGVPALVNLGVPVLAAHLFVFYLANMSAITPPVAVGCLVASRLAEASFMRTALTAVRLALPGFLLPFLFVVRPEILGLGASLLDQIVFTLLALVAIFSLNVAIEGFLLRRLTVIERVVLIPAAFGVFFPSLWLTLLGVAIFAAVLALQFLPHRRAAHTQAEPAAR